jgi:YD repeat-containing protein
VPGRYHSYLNETTDYSYDALNRRTRDAFSGTFAGTRASDYTWDAGSNMTSVKDAGGTVSYAYDNLNRLSKWAEPGGDWAASPAVLCTTFGYDARDNRTSTSYPNNGLTRVPLVGSSVCMGAGMVQGSNLRRDFQDDDSTWWGSE